MTVTPLSFLTHHTSQIRQQHASQTRPGRKPSDHSELIGQRSGRIVCVDVLAPDSKRQAHAICVCDCGRASSPRVSDFAAGKAGSCECIKIDRFKAHQRRRAENLSPDVVRAVFLDSAKTGRWPGADIQVAARHGVPSHAVREICQLHKERLLTKYGDRVRAEKYRYSIKRRDLDKNLDVIEFHWIIKHTPRHDDDEGIEVDWDELTPDEQALFLKWCRSEEDTSATSA